MNDLPHRISSDLQLFVGDGKLNRDVCDQEGKPALQENPVRQQGPCLQQFKCRWCLIVCCWLNFCQAKALSSSHEGIYPNVDSKRLIELQKQIPPYHNCINTLLCDQCIDIQILLSLQCALTKSCSQTYLEQAKINFVPNYKSIPIQKITTTVGLNIGYIEVDGIRLKFWDLGGQEELQSLWDKYYAESNGVIYVVDSADRDRFDESKDAFDKMIRNPVLEGVPLLVLANKQDMQSASHLSEINKVFYDSLRLVGQRQCTFHGVSALNG
ncbi:unnamed protein product [Schistosoma curassoni]|uniref:ADP-ribosylation factor-related protein 1 n=1 Tax=Schistosoma curassoni TaxID=6186 RepID=A0A183KW11_9TREM|nr:unnamed protein product [Schistosoma curassoni]